MEIQPFTKDVRSISPIVAEQVPWFKGKDMAISLKYTNPAKALRDHVDEEDKKSLLELLQGKNETFTPSNQQPHETYINESGFYSLALRSKQSKQPAAKSFKTLGHARSFAFDQEAWKLQRTRLHKPHRADARASGRDHLSDSTPRRPAPKPGAT